MKKLVGVLAVLYLLTIALPMRPAHAGVATHATSTIGGADAVKLFIGNIAGFSVVGEVMPIILQPKENAPPDIEPYAIFAQNASPWAQPMVVQLHRIDYTSDNPISAKYCAKLVIKPSWANVPVQYALTLDTTEKSENYPNSQMLLMNGEALTSVYGLLKKIPSGVSYDFDRPTHVISTIGNEDCGPQDQGVSGKPVTIGVQSVASFPGTEIRSPGVPETIYEWVMRTIHTATGEIERLVQEIATEVVPMRIEITAKHGDSHVTNGWCFFGRCDPDATDEERTGKIAEVNGSLSGGLIPIQKNKTPIAFNAIVTQTIQLLGLDLPGSKKTSVDLEMPYKNANSGMEDTKTGACMFSPLNDQSRLKIGHAADYVAFDDKCKSKPIPNCPIDLIEQGKGKSAPSCSLTNAGGYKSLLLNPDFINPIIPGKTYKYADSLPGGVPPLMKKVLDAAGAAYNVPASVLLGTMLEEGAFNHTGTWDWTDETVKKFSDCTIKDPVPSCNDASFQSGTGAKGPFGYIQYWWDKYMGMGTGGPYLNMMSDPDWKKIIDNIPKGNITPCNFTDAAFMAARELGIDQSHYYQAMPAQCTVGTTTYDLNITNPPASCSDWDPNRTALARLQYDDQACDDQVTRMVTTFNGH